LFFLRDPAAVLRRLVGYVRSGGLVAFQEPGNATLQPVAVPPSPLLDQLWEWIMQTYRHADLDLSMGLHLFRLFAEAGLPAPEMHLDAAVGGGPDWAGYDYMASLIRTLLPRIVQFGIATPEEVGVDTLAERLRAEVVGQHGVVTTWSFITAWARKRSREPPYRLTSSPLRPPLQHDLAISRPMTAICASTPRGGFADRH
jgi:hypothetical protein